MPNRELARRAAEEIIRKKRVVALTGAGISVESGIPSFRGHTNGLWTRYDPEDYADISAFHRNPAKVWTMLRELQDVIQGARPNAGHLGLAQLEEMGYLRAIITQNIDGLHQEAGSKEVIEFHGNNRWLVCLNCHRRYPHHTVSLETLPPKCTCQGVLKPDAVFFGEPIPLEALYRAREESFSCKVMLVIGTSAIVYPAAEMPHLAKRRGGTIIEINPEETPLTRSVSDYFLEGNAGEIIPGLVEEVARLSPPTP
ncbi:MAG: NAD-dependent deacylase [Candidatus Tectomicrobia bacterium]|uniref:protein acetyllysine N-acetyltransferase n=1 Tax=Tectimicrobiota bacterium TaxID=2528274 RepID=A0A932CQ33_UNCTE|nr:NAD-dependent deacylase [Candidatus Tectomicrobia bacterium]